MRIAGMCLDWRVLAGLGTVGLGILLFAPELLAGAIPLLLLAACPLSMVLMGLFMGRGMGGMQGSQCAPQGQSVSFSQREARAEQLAGLRNQLAEVEARQAALAQQVAALEAADAAEPAPAGVREAGVAARATERRV